MACPIPISSVRTSGELRISNFLLWQLAYSEIYISAAFWPDFRLTELYEAIRNYQQRERRFGLLSEQVAPKRKAASYVGAFLKVYQDNPLLRPIFLVLLALFVLAVPYRSAAQRTKAPTFKILGISVEGNDPKFGTETGAIINNTGLKVGNEISIPGDQTRNAITRLWALKIFSDVQILIDNKVGDGVYLLVKVRNCRVSTTWTWKARTTLQGRHPQEGEHHARTGDHARRREEVRDRHQEPVLRRRASDGHDPDVDRSGDRYGKGEQGRSQVQDR